jgi:hypothetical protein
MQLRTECGTRFRVIAGYLPNSPLSSACTASTITFYIPTKTPAVLVQSLDNSCSFCRRPFQVCLTSCFEMALFTYFLFVILQSSCSRSLITDSHLFWISSSVKGALSFAITLSHRIFQMKYADSATRIFQSLVSPPSRFPVSG